MGSELKPPTDVCETCGESKGIGRQLQRDCLLCHHKGIIQESERKNNPSLSAKDSEIERLKETYAHECAKVSQRDREIEELKAQLTASEAKRKVLGAECRAWRAACGCEPDRGERWKALHVEGHMGWWWRPLPEADATDAASALEEP